MMKEIDMDKKYPDWHGSPYDRGSADAWYNRPRDPHKYPDGTYKGERVSLTDPDEIDAYMFGYQETWIAGLHQDWGDI
jgi:hypothetical protein